jgi:hypothetical protein
MHCLGLGRFSNWQPSFFTLVICSAKERLWGGREGPFHHFPTFPCIEGKLYSRGGWWGPGLAPFPPVSCAATTACREADHVGLLRPETVSCLLYGPSSRFSEAQGLYMLPPGGCVGSALP